MRNKTKMMICTAAVMLPMLTGCVQRIDSITTTEQTKIDVSEGIDKAMKQAVNETRHKAVGGIGRYGKR